MGATDRRQRREGKRPGLRTVIGRLPRRHAAPSARGSVLRARRGSARRRPDERASGTWRKAGRSRCVSGFFGFEPLPFDPLRSAAWRASSVVRGRTDWSMDCGEERVRSSLGRLEVGRIAARPEDASPDRVRCGRCTSRGSGSSRHLRSPMRAEGAETDARWIGAGQSTERGRRNTPFRKKSDAHRERPAFRHVPDTRAVAPGGGRRGGGVRVPEDRDHPRSYRMPLPMRPHRAVVMKAGKAASGSCLSYE